VSLAAPPTRLNQVALLATLAALSGGSARAGMQEIQLDGRAFLIDEEGFLQQPEVWDEEVARLFAAHEGIPAMTPEHWAVVRAIRAHFLQHGNAPMVRALCQATNLNLRTIYKLFTAGPAKGACKIAGLPKPEGCV
jgi:dissimilatory sulfite reductase related protein